MRSWCFRSSLLTFLMFIAAPALVRAEVPPAAGALPVEKFVDETAVLVADVDLMAVDLDALRGWGVALLKTGGMDPKEVDGVDKTLKEGLGQAAQWLGDFRNAGGKRAYLVVTANQAGPFFVAIPLGAGADSAVMTRLLTADGRL